MAGLLKIAFYLLWDAVRYVALLFFSTAALRAENLK